MPYRKLTSLLVYLKGSKSKDSLKAEMPALYKHFDEVWSIRNQHMVRDLPQSYIFFSEIAATSHILNANPLLSLPRGIQAVPLFLNCHYSYLIHKGHGAILHVPSAKDFVLDTTVHKWWTLQTKNC